MQLVHNHTLSAVYNERALRSHVGNGPEVHVLHDGFKVLVFRIGAIQFQFGLEGHTVGQPAFDALIDGVARGVDEIVQKLQHELVSRIGDGKVFAEYLKQAFRFTVLRVGFQLEKLLEGAQLDVQKVGA